MFTGIVKGAYPIKFIKQQPKLLQYGIWLPEGLLKDLAIGASVAIDGVCQSVTKICDQIVFFDAIEETLERTTLKFLKENQLVNVERAARFGDEIGGHFLSGHVFGTGHITEISENNWKVQCNPLWIKYLFEKGFVAVDGASLTVGKVEKNGFFYFHLIPETLKMTTFSQKKVGDELNLEFDAQTQTIVDTLERLLPEYKN